MKYRIIDKNDRGAHELKKYSWREVLNFFEPNEDLEDSHEKWDMIYNKYDLDDFLEQEADGMEQNYEVVEVPETNEEIGTFFDSNHKKMTEKTRRVISETDFDLFAEVFGGIDTIEELNKFIDENY